jgi:PKD repeat protein
VLNVGGTDTFQLDAAFSGAVAGLTDFNPVYLPCDPSGAVVGDPRAGTNCYGSVGSPGNADFRIGVRSHNANGWSQAPFISSALTIHVPTARIAGFADGVLRVLSGGAVDARGSDGNIVDAIFQWNFFDQLGQTGNGVGSPTGALLSSGVPAASRSFRLTVTYKGGYTAPVINGAVQQVDLVPDFSLSPATVLHGASLTLTNQMQKGATTTLNAVRYEVSASSTPPASFSGALISSFLSGGGTAAVTAPATDGAFFVHLQYDFSGPQGANQLLTVSKPFSTTSFAPSPSVLIYRNAAGTQLASTFIPMQLSTGTTYYLFDRETLPSGVTHPGSQFYLSTNRDAGTVAGDQSLGTHAGAGPVSFTPSSTCSACSIKAVVGGVIGKINVAISSATPPPPPPPPPTGNVNASLSCPAQGTAGTELTCTASATGGSSYSYSWNWGENVLAGGFTPGPATSSHTYSSAGAFTVTVRVTSGSASDTATARVNIAAGGPPRPSAGYTLTGATHNQFNGSWEAEGGKALTFTGTEPDAAATFSWVVGDGGPTLTGRSVSHAFSSPGSKTVELTVTGGGTATSGTTSTAIRITVTPPRFQALMIPGAGHIDPTPPATDGTWATDLAITNPGTQPMTVTLHYEPFGTTFPADLSTIPFNSVNSIPLSAGQSWAETDVIKARLNKDARGVLILKYEGGNADPIATATVYYTQQGRSFGSSLPTFKVGPYGTATAQSAQAANEQTLVGLRNDESYRFNVQLFNASGEGGVFRLTAFGEDGAPLAIRGGNESGALDLAVGAFQQTLLQSAELGLEDATKRYVLKASPVSGSSALIAAASALDRRNNDLVQVSDDTPRISAAADSAIEYFIPGVGRIGRDEVASDPHWRTDLNLYSNSSLPRDLTFEYRYTDRNGVEQRVLAPVTIGPSRSMVLDDVVGTLLDGYTPADLKQENPLGVLRISYRAAADSTTAPLLIGGRIYDDRGPAGTAGMQLFVYSNGESVAPGSPLVLPGAQQNLRFRTNIGFFAMGDLPTVVRVTAVKQDGSIGGTYDFALNDGSRNGHYAQLPMSAVPGIVGEAMTIRVEVLSGSRIGAYVVTVDQISTDTVFVQGRPTRITN